MENLTLEKISNIYKEMLANGNSKEEIIKNIFINYSTFADNNQIIYNHKDYISNIFHTDFRNIFLIGSRHLGLKIEKSELKIKSEFDEKTDYDYAIIDNNLFSKYFDEFGCEEKQYKSNFCKGFLHPLYNPLLKKHIEEKLKDIPGKISICIYLTEKSFIKKLYSYYGEIIFANISKIISLDQVETLK